MARAQPAGLPGEFPFDVDRIEADAADGTWDFHPRIYSGGQEEPQPSVFG